MKNHQLLEQLACIFVAVTSIGLSPCHAADLPVFAPKEVGMSADKLGKVGEIVNDLVAKKRLAGASVIVARNGKVCFFETYGKMDNERNKAIEQAKISNDSRIKAEQRTEFARQVIHEERMVEVDWVEDDLMERPVTLAISATSNHSVQLAMEGLKEIKGCEMHMTHMPTPGDEAGLRRLGVNLTTDPAFVSHRLFVR